MASNIFGVDLGTVDIKMFSKSVNQFFTGKNTIAIKNKKEVYAIGDEAYAMYEKAPGIINVSFPVNNGVIADFNNMQRLVESFIEKNCKNNLKGADFIVAVPTDITEVEKRSFFELFFKGKFRPKNVYLCEKPLAAAVGIGLEIKDPTGYMVVDMGADTTEISVISLGGLVLSDLVRIGGNSIDDAIVTHIKRKYSLVIGMKTAQMLKISLASATGIDKGSVVTVGRDVVSGLPVEKEITSADINDAIAEPINQICTAIKLILEKTPPELAKDIIHAGIYLSGGGSNLGNVDDYINKQTNILVNRTEEPELNVVKGLNKIVSDSNYKSIISNMQR